MDLTFSSAISRLLFLGMCEFVGPAPGIAHGIPEYLLKLHLQYCKFVLVVPVDRSELLYKLIAYLPVVRQPNLP